MGGFEVGREDWRRVIDDRAAQRLVVVVVVNVVNVVNIVLFHSSIHVQRRDSPKRFDEYGNVILTKEELAKAEPPRGTVKRIKEFDKKTNQQRGKEQSERRADLKTDFTKKLEHHEVGEMMCLY